MWRPVQSRHVRVFTIRRGIFTRYRQEHGEIEQTGRHRQDLGTGNLNPMLEG